MSQLETNPTATIGFNSKILRFLSFENLGIDSSKRYDVYCTLRGGATVVYRNVLIKRATPLFVKDDALSKVGEFVELEQADGKSVFVMRDGILRRTWREENAYYLFGAVNELTIDMDTGLIY